MHLRSRSMIIQQAYLCEGEQEVSIVSDDLPRWFWWLLVFKCSLLRLQVRKYVCAMQLRGTYTCPMCRCFHTCFFTAKPAPFPKPANGCADLPLPPGRRDSGLRDTSSSFMVGRPDVALSETSPRVSRRGNFRVQQGSAVIIFCQYLKYLKCLRQESDTYETCRWQ